MRMNEWENWLLFLLCKRKWENGTTFQTKRLNKASLHVNRCVCVCVCTGEMWRKQPKKRRIPYWWKSHEFNLFIKKPTHTKGSFKEEEKGLTKCVYEFMAVDLQNKYCMKAWTFMHWYTEFIWFINGWSKGKKYIYISKQTTRC